MTPAHVDLEHRGGVAVLRLNDPERRNVLSPGMVADLVTALDECELDERVHAVVLTGSGSAFCAGAELDNLLAAAQGDEDRLREVYRGFLRVASCALPTIAAVNGPAVGAGLNLALACDVRVAGESALFDCRFTRLGLHPGGGHTWMLSRAVGHQAAADMLLFQTSLGGEAASAAGLALRCVPDAELLDVAVDLGLQAGDTDRELLRTVKRTLSESTEASLTEMVAVEFDRQVTSLRTPAFRRAMVRAGARSRTATRQ